MSQDIYDKIVKIITIIIIVITFIFVTIFKLIPELKNIIGSSDKYINYENYDTVIGIKINTKTDFLLVIADNKVQNIVFLSNSSLSLYNQNIEGNSLSESLDDIINILRTKGVLLDELTLIKYPSNTSYETVKNLLTKSLTITETTSTYQILAEEYSIKTYQDDKEQLQVIETYSKKLARNYKNKKILEETINEQKEKNY